MAPETMSNPKTADDERLETTVDETATPAESVDVQPADETTTESTTKKVCENCGSGESWQGLPWCPACGFYPAYGTCVDTGPHQEEAAVELNWGELIPVWIRVLGAGMLAIVLLSFIARVVLPTEGAARLSWALAQFFGGLAAFLVAHVSAFMLGVPKSEHASPFDLFMKPIAVWKTAQKGLPSDPWRFWSAGWGLCAMICALTVVGGIRYSAMFDDWGFEKRAKPNLVQAIVEQAKEEQEGDKSLQQAMDDLVGEEEDELPEEKIVLLPKQECLIFGYTESPDRGFSRLMLASVIENKVRFVGTVSVDDVPEEIRVELLKRLPELEQSRPFVKCKFSATWLKPVLLCEVAYKDWTKKQRLRDPVVLDLLNDVDKH